MKTAFLTALLLLHSVYAVASEEQMQLYGRLLTTGITVDATVATRALEITQADSPLRDQVAYALHSLLDEDSGAQESDDWIAQKMLLVLNQDKSGRYRPFLAARADRIYDVFGSDTYKYVENIIQALPAPGDNVFKVQPHAIAKLRSEYRQRFQTRIASRQAAAFYRILAGEHFDSVLPIWGLPDEVRGIETRRGNRLRRGSIRMEITYNGLLKLDLINELDTPVGWYVHKAEYLTDTLAANPLDRIPMQTRIASAHATLLREYARQLFAAKDYDKTIMDAAMARVFKEKDTTDTQMEDAIAWLCKYVGYSKDKSYMTAFLKLRQESRSIKLQRYAKRLYEILDRSDKLDF